ncbi:MAG: hypothetical protein AAGI15_13840 [Pseudomonadota bacterium]
MSVDAVVPPELLVSKDTTVPEPPFVQLLPGGFVPDEPFVQGLGSLGLPLIDVN